MSLLARRWRNRNPSAHDEHWNRGVADHAVGD
jgi:hypothetical protein